MVDYHIHTNHSIDAQGSLNDYVERALALGLKEICFTNHCELDEKRNDNLIRFNGNVMPITRDALHKLQNEVLAQKELCKHRGLKVKFGIEVGFFDGIGERLKTLTDGLMLDYILAGIHCLDHICIDSSKECTTFFQRSDAKGLLEKYFKVMEILIRSELFDAVAHFDVYKKYGLNFYGPAIKIFDRDRIYHLFRLMAEYELGLEINTAGWRRCNEFYPSDDFMNLAIEAGIEIITVGSDCHKLEDLSKGIKEAQTYARAHGFKRIYGFERRMRLPLDIL
ncbi:MAG: histidinol-phosphatase HisJ family protein [bacterium]